MRDWLRPYSNKQYEIVSGVDIRMVQKALGHSSLQVTERYYSKWDNAQQDILHDTLRKAMTAPTAGK